MKGGYEHAKATCGHRLDSCELIEQIPGKVSGWPIVRGTRIMPAGIVNSFDMGDSIEDIDEDWRSLSVAQIKRLIEFAHVHREQPRS